MSLRSVNTRRKESDFVEVCRRIIKKPRDIRQVLTANEVIDLALKSRAPGYYVSALHAAAKVNAMVNHPADGDTLSPARKKWQEIMSRAEMIVDNRPWLTLEKAVALVVEQGNASSFFMSRSTAQKIFRRHFLRHGYFVDSRA